ncbi:hypothetical protein IL252_14420 (plasmid) [Halomicrobium sp. IBSBa]|uniref:hypothetical protein n=1 Tax=Halomicrobium sp. IBSBa TaxID=2778916 RepID=UPI001ABF509F|nr:hypothetical protein [Halomicrobium sp. IBSBa]MBO4249011.1 hypothetical protein [Halomicrobium sp. IBSBa]
MDDAAAARRCSPAVHVHDEQSLLERPQRARDPLDIVMTPEQLHQRNCKRALAQRSRPRSSVLFRTPIDVASRVLSTHEGRAVETLDRLDRLRLFRTLLDEPPAGVEALTTVYGTALTEHAESIEVAREELQLLTGGRADRAAALDDVRSSLSAAASADTRALRTGVGALVDALDERVAAYPASGAVFRACASAIEATDGAVWSATFPTIERIDLAGVSTLGAPVRDFLTAVEAATDVDVHYYLRAGTGPRIARRLATRSGIADTAPDRVDESPDGRLDQPPRTTEIAVETRHDEARTAAAIVDGALQAGASVDDVALVARDVDRYERPVGRALSTYGRHPSVWTQLPLTRTLPYRLVVAVCELLGAAATDDIAADTLLEPLALQWTPPRGGHDRPTPPSTVHALGRALDGASRSRVGWLTAVRELDGVDTTAREAAAGLLNWIGQQPAEPAPADICPVLVPVVDAFDESVLPRRAASDGPDYTETAQTARAVERVAGTDDGDHLLRETRAKYADWLERGHLDRSWDTVLTVLDALATARPGRREHANAERIDVLDATDAWLRTYPLVVALGFVDGEWPQRPHGELPAELRAAIVRGQTRSARQFPVRGAWSTERDLDHFADAVRAATDHLIVTRYTSDVDGVRYERSPLLAHLDADRLAPERVRRLRAGDASTLHDWIDDGPSVGGGGR